MFKSTQMFPKLLWPIWSVTARVGKVGYWVLFQYSDVQMITAQIGICIIHIWIVWIFWKYPMDAANMLRKMSNYVVAKLQLNLLHLYEMQKKIWKAQKCFAAPGSFDLIIEKGNIWPSRGVHFSPLRVFVFFMSNWFCRMGLHRTSLFCIWLKHSFHQ